MDQINGIKINNLMLYREIIAVCPKTHKKHIHTLCGQDVEFLDLKHGGACFKVGLANMRPSREVFAALGNLNSSSNMT
jgi:hypothetical protein